MLVVRSLVVDGKHSGYQGCLRHASSGTRRLGIADGQSGSPPLAGTHLDRKKGEEPGDTLANGWSMCYSVFLTTELNPAEAQAASIEMCEYKLSLQSAPLGARCGCLRPVGQR